MGLFLIFLFILVIGVLLRRFVLPRVGYRTEDAVEWLVATCVVIGGVGVIMLVSALGVTALRGTGIDTKYTVDKTYIETTAVNDSLTADERTFIIKKALRINEDILYAKAYKDDFWIGWYTVSKWADKPLIDITQIQKARPVLRVLNQ